MTRYMLLLRGGQDSLDEYTPEQFQAIIQPYIEWANRLRAEGRYHAGDELKDGGRVVRMRGSSAVVDGPFTETREAIGGYFIVEASNDDEITEIAKGCPILKHGGFVDIRQIVDH